MPFWLDLSYSSRICLQLFASSSFAFFLPSVYKRSKLQLWHTKKCYNTWKLNALLAWVKYVNTVVNYVHSKGRHISIPHNNIKENWIHSCVAEPTSRPRTIIRSPQSKVLYTQEPACALTILLNQCTGGCKDCQHRSPTGQRWSKMPNESNSSETNTSTPSALWLQLSSWVAQCWTLCWETLGPVGESSTEPISCAARSRSFRTAVGSEPRCFWIANSNNCSGLSDAGSALKTSQCAWTCISHIVHSEKVMETVFRWRWSNQPTARQCNIKSLRSSSTIPSEAFAKDSAKPPIWMNKR